MTQKQFDNFQALAAYSEEMKYEGFKRANLGKTPEERCEGMKQAIEGYYIRERQMADETGRRLPSFMTYLVHFISSKRNYYNDQPLIHEAIQSLGAKYGYVDDPNIDEGGKSWNRDR